MAGRAIASIWTALFILVAAAEGVAVAVGEGGDGGGDGEAIAVGVFLVAAAAVSIVSWLRPGLAFPLFLALGIAGVALGVATAGHNHWIAALVAGGPYLLAALLVWPGRSPARRRGVR